MDIIFQFIQVVQDFFNNSFFGFIHDLFFQVTVYFVTWSIESKLYFMVVAWDVAQSLLANFQVSQLVNSSWGSIDSRIVSHANFFKIPEAITIIAQSYVTSFILRVIG